METIDGWQEFPYGLHVCDLEWYSDFCVVNIEEPLLQLEKQTAYGLRNLAKDGIHMDLKLEWTDALFTKSKFRGCPNMLCVISDL